MQGLRFRFLGSVIVDRSLAIASRDMAVDRVTAYEFAIPRVESYSNAEAFVRRFNAGDVVPCWCVCPLATVTHCRGPPCCLSLR